MVGKFTLIWMSGAPVTWVHRKYICRLSEKHTGLIFCMPGIVFVTGFSPGGLKIVRDDMIR